MSISKVSFDGNPLIDLSTDTVASASDILNGKIGHLNDGSVVTGTAGANDIVLKNGFKINQIINIPKDYNFSYILSGLYRNIDQVPAVREHYYYFDVNYKDISANTTAGYVINGTNKAKERVGDWSTNAYPRIEKWTSTLDIYVRLYGLEDGQTISGKVTFTTIDLTEMFGAGNEPSSVDEIKRYITEYIPYNTGIQGNLILGDIASLQSMLPEGIGVVDLGSLTWTNPVAGQPNFYQASFALNKQVNWNETASLCHELYDSNTYDNTLNHDFYGISSFNNYLQVRTLTGNSPIGILLYKKKDS